MADKREAASGPFPGASVEATQQGAVSASDRERVLLLECRLEQLRSSLGEARDEADRARSRLAEASAREADQAQRYGLIQLELAEARAEVLDLYRRLERSEALRAELEGHFFESGALGDAEELTRLRRKALVEHERALVSERTLAQLRGRVQELLSSRDTLLTRVAEWQTLIRQESPEAADLAEFIAELRREILDLEQRNLEGEAREVALRERLTLADSASAGLAEPVVIEPVTIEAEAADPGEAVTAEPATDEPGPSEGVDSVARPELAPARGLTETLVAELAFAETPALRSELLVRPGRSGDGGAVEALRPWTATAEPAVRASAYEALGRLLERDASTLEPILRTGLADGDARVRRRVVLAAATARGVALRSLLDPLSEDADPQVRRIVRQVLRQAPALAEGDPHAKDILPPESDTRPEGDPVRLPAASGAAP